MINVTWQNGADAFIDAVASSSSTPGGGSVSGAIGALGCSLVMMSTSITMKIKTTLPEDAKTLNTYLDSLVVLKEDLKTLIAQDARAYENVVRARKLPKTSAERAPLLEEALKEAAMAPVNTGRKVVEVIEKIKEIEPKISPIIMSDMNCAKYLLTAAVACCKENINANLPYIKDDAFKAVLEEELNFLSKF